MAEKLQLTLRNRVQAWELIKGQLFPFLAGVMQGGAVWVLSLAPETRSQAQNRLMWPLLPNAHKPASARNREVLPQPDGPCISRASPSLTVTLRLLSKGTSQKTENKAR